MRGFKKRAVFCFFGKPSVINMIAAMPNQKRKIIGNSIRSKNVLELSSVWLNSGIIVIHHNLHL